MLRERQLKQEVLIMKRFSLLLALAILSKSGFAVNPDGCFQLYVPGSLAPVLCVSGASEEGIGGMGIRVALVGPNSLQVHTCEHTTGVQLDFLSPFNRTELYFDGNSTIVFDGAVDPSSNLEEGTVKIGAAKRNYLRLSDSQSAPILQAISDSGKCQQ